MMEIRGSLVTGLVFCLGGILLPIVGIAIYSINSHIYLTVEMLIGLTFIGLGGCSFISRLLLCFNKSPRRFFFGR